MWDAKPFWSGRGQRGQLRRSLPVLRGGTFTVIAIPGWAALLLPKGATIHPLQVLGTLLLDVLLPLAVGLFIKARYPDQAASWYRGLGNVSTWALILVMILMFVTNLSVLLSLIGSFALLISLLLCVSRPVRWRADLELVAPIKRTPKNNDPERRR